MREKINPGKTTPEPAQSGGIGGWIGAAILNGMFGLVALMGLVTLQAGIRLIVTGEQHWGVALMITAMGGLFTTIGLGFFYFHYVKAPVWRARARALEVRYPNQPWMRRADWAGRRVTDSSLGAMIFLWVWVVGWWGAIVFIWSMNRDKILAAAADSWWQGALGLLFPLGGLIGLALAWSTTRTWLRFGRSTLRIDTLPGYLGQAFRGTLEANFRTRPAALEAEIVCERVTWRTTRSGGKTTRERISQTLWSQTHAIEPSRVMLSDRGGRATLAITVPLPPDQPPCGLDENGDGVVWRLSVREVRGGDGVAGGSREGPAFAASFEVPVFGR